MKPKTKEHILVYQNSDSNNDLIKLMKNNPDKKFVVYGFHKDEHDGNILFRSFTEKQLFSDFKDAKCVITKGGFSLITEALQLEKPILSIPVNGQYEQILNAMYVNRLGYGEHHDVISQVILDNFLENVETYRKNIQTNYHKHSDNDETLKTLKNTIEELFYE